VHSLDNRIDGKNQKISDGWDRHQVQLSVFAKPQLAHAASSSQESMESGAPPKVSGEAAHPT